MFKKRASALDSPLQSPGVIKFSSAPTVRRDQISRVQALKFRRTAKKQGREKKEKKKKKRKNGKTSAAES